MNSQQYEELCRYFLSNKLGVSLDEIKSVSIPNPSRPGLQQYRHQIDLCWETESDLVLYLNIANAKWRDNIKVDQPDVMLLQQVKVSVAAHKAMMLTNRGYTAGAIAVAQHEGIALHVVRPDFLVSLLPAQGSATIQGKLMEIASSSTAPIFLHEIVHKAFDFRESSTHARIPGPPTGSSTYQTKIMSGCETKVGGGYSNKAGTHGDSSGSGTTHSGSPATKSGGQITTK